MNPLALYHRMEEVSQELNLAIDRVTHMTNREKLVFEALWVRLDDLVEQIPEAFQEAVRDAVADVEEDNV